MVQIILLSAGLSKRFGEENKLLHKVNNIPIFLHTLTKLSQARMGNIIIVTGLDRLSLLSKIPERIKYTEAFNPNYQKGMTSSIKAAVEISPSSSTGYMICLADQIHITSSSYAKIVKQFEDLHRVDTKSILIPKHNGQHGNPVVLSSAYKEDILALDFTDGCKPIVQKNRNHQYYLELEDPGIIKDIDTQEDLEHLLP